MIERDQGWEGGQVPGIRVARDIVIDPSSMESREATMGEDVWTTGQDRTEHGVTGESLERDLELESAMQTDHTRNSFRVEELARGNT